MAPQWYLPLLLRLMRWWAVGCMLITAIIAACVLVDWLTPVGWGYPWYVLPILIGCGLFGFGVHRAAGERFRRLSIQ